MSTRTVPILVLSNKAQSLPSQRAPTSTQGLDSSRPGLGHVGCPQGPSQAPLGGLPGNCTSSLDTCQPSTSSWMDSDEGPNTSSCGRAGAFHRQVSQLRRSTERWCGLSFSPKAIPWSQATVSLGVAMWRWFHCSASTPRSNELAPEFLLGQICRTRDCPAGVTPHATCLPCHAMPAASTRIPRPIPTSCRPSESREREGPGGRGGFHIPQRCIQVVGKGPEMTLGSHTSRPATRPSKTPAITPATHLARRRCSLAEVRGEVGCSMGRMGLSKIASAGTAP